MLEDRDEYVSENVFWVPPEARWSYLQARAKQPEIGQLVDEAMVAIERENPKLKNVLPKEYARPTLDKQRLGELINLIGTIGLGDAGRRLRPCPNPGASRHDRHAYGGKAMVQDGERHHRRSIRLPGYDYAQVGAYFVTLVTAGRQCLFGEVADATV